MDAVVYTSNTGFTAQYAALLGGRTGLPVYTLAEAAGALPRGAEIVYLGWLMGGGVKGLKQALARYAVRAVCGVGMSPAGARLEETRKANALDPAVPLFLLQGGYDPARLRGVSKLMMSLVAKSTAKELSAKTARTAEENDMLELMLHGGSRVSAEGLAPVLEWLAAQA